MAINGTVQATGEFAPTSTGDTYAIIDAKYMRDGFRNVDTLADLDLITEDRRFAGMVVGVSGGTAYYKLNQGPWAFDFTDWSDFTTGGGTEYWVSGSTGLGSLKTINTNGTNATGDYSIANGYGNTATAHYSLAMGGAYNVAGSLRSGIIGGQINSILIGSINSFIGGSENSSITGGTHCAIIGGYLNRIGGTRSLVFGGGYNKAIAPYSSIIGGRYNSTGGSGLYSTILGGKYNRVVNYYSSILGGTNNIVTGQGSAIIGGTNITGSSTNTVYVPNLNIDSTPANDNALTQVLVRATDGTIKYRSSTTIGSFTGNTSATCISDLYVSDIYGCSPVTIHGSTTGSGTHSFKVMNLSAELLSIRDDGYSEFTKNGGEAVFGTSSNFLNHIQNRLVQYSNSASFTGFHANRDGIGISMRASSANNISTIESTGTMTFSTAWDNNFNNSGSLAMLIYGTNQYVGIGMDNGLSIPNAKLHIKGTGNTNSSSAFLVENSDGTDLIRTTNDGLSMFRTTNPTSPFGGVIQAIHAESTVTDPTMFASTQAVTTTYSPTGHASGYIRNFSTNVIKYGIYNAPYIAGNTSYARNDSSSGTTTDVISYDAVAFCNAAGNTTNLFAFQGNSQIQAGANVTNLGGLKLIFGTNQSGTSITNMYGVLITTPQNTGGDVANTYGVHIQSNVLGSTANWGLYQDGVSVGNYFGGEVNIGTTTNEGKLTVKATGDTSASNVLRVDGASVNNLFTVRNDGRIGINSAPSTGDRVFITAGSGNDGAINISSTNLADNGYAILAQGGTSSSNYNGVWSDVTGGGNGISKSFFGNSGIAGYSYNYGGYFSARNGTNGSVGVFASANGGDSVTPNDYAVGVWGNVGASEADDRRAGYFTIPQSTNINNSLSYGMKFEVTYISAVANESVYGVHANASTIGTGVTNTAGYFKATNASNNENYAIVTDGGDSGFGTTTPTDMLHVNGVTGSTQFRLEKSYTPTSSADTAGNIGSVAWDDDYWYQKTNTGWGRIAWSYAF